MILESDRLLLEKLVKLGIWEVKTVMRLPEVLATKDTRLLKEQMLKRQEVDDLHHAPCCPANHYHRCRLVLSECTCGAKC